AGFPRALDGDVVVQVRERARQVNRPGQGDADSELVGAAPGVSREDGRAQGVGPGVGQRADCQVDHLRVRGYGAVLECFEAGTGAVRRSRTPGWTVVSGGTEVSQPRRERHDVAPFENWSAVSLQHPWRADHAPGLGSPGPGQPGSWDVLVIVRGGWLI